MNDIYIDVPIETDNVPEFVSTKANGVDGTKGRVLDSIKLSPQTFGVWTPQTIPEELIKKELAFAIAKRLEYDTHIVRDEQTGRTMIKASTVVYMKPDNVELFKKTKELEAQISIEQKKHNTEMKEADELRTQMDDILDRTYSNLKEANDLYYDLSLKTTDYVYLSKRLFSVIKWRIKVNLFSLMYYIPFR